MVADFKITPEITFIIESLKGFQDFAPAVRRGANALYTAEISITQLHFYANTLNAGLGGGR